MQSFFALLDELLACPSAERIERERRIHEVFELERAVLALDMSGYSLSVRRDGVLSHLCKIRRMQQRVAPLIERFDGEVVRELADNILAAFPEPAKAVQAALAINHAVHLSQQGPASEALLSVSIGIDYGKLLLISGHDCFGDPVNIAFKLGEEVARAGEILITEKAMRALGESAGCPFEALRVSLSGVEVLAYRVGYEVPQAIAIGN
jgi:adenylate cyclase